MAGPADRLRAAPVLGALALAGLVVAWWAARFGEGREPLDTVLYFVPSYAAIAERFRQRAIPLWNPWNLCGLPWIGTLQAGVFYPPHLLYVVLPLHRALAAGSVLHLFIAALGTAGFVRRLGLGWAPAIVAAAVFALRGSVATSVPSTNLLEALAWLPIGAIAVVDLVRAPGGRPIVVLAAATGLSFLAGYPQPTVYVVYTWGSLLLALLIHERPSWAGAGTRIAAFGGALALGALLAAVQLLPALELMREGGRAPEGLTDRTMFPVASWMTPATHILSRQAIEGTPFAVGLLALALAPAALLAPGRRALGVWAVAMTAISAVMALGRVTPLFDLYLALPALRLFRNPGRLLVVTDFTVAIAAALGLSAVIGSGDGGRLRAPAVLMALGLAGVLVLVARGWAPDGGRLVMIFAVAGGVAVVALLVSGAPWRPAVGAAIAAAAVIEIASNPGPDFRMPYEAADVAAYEPLARDMRQVGQLAGHERVWRALPGLQISNALKLSPWYRLRTINDYEPVNLRRQADYFTYFAEGATTPTRPPWLFDGDVHTLERPREGTPAATRRRLLDLAAVRYVVFVRNAMLSRPIREYANQAGLVPRRQLARELLVLENPRAVPRAFVTYRTWTAPDDPEALLATMTAPAFDPLTVSFVEGPPPFDAASDAPRGHAATFVRDDDTDVELEVTLARPGLVVLADSFYPGWHATVNGTPAPIVATNHLFRGVPAPAGTHRVRFVYTPASVRIGGWLSAAGLGVVIVLWLGGRRRSKG